MMAYLLRIVPMTLLVLLIAAPGHGARRHDGSALLAAGPVFSVMAETPRTNGSPDPLPQGGSALLPAVLILPTHARRAARTGRPKQPARHRTLRRRRPQPQAPPASVPQP